MTSQAELHGAFPDRYKNGQFRKGRSGNPSGRPRKCLSTASVFRDMLLSKVDLLSDGRAIRVTVLEAIAQRVKKEALKGSLAGLEKGIAVAQKYSLADLPPPEPKYDLSLLSDEELEWYGRLAAKLQGIEWDEISDLTDDGDLDAG